MMTMLFVFWSIGVLTGFFFGRAFEKNREMKRMVPVWKELHEARLKLSRLRG